MMVVCVSVGCAVVALLWSTCLSGRTYSAVATLEASDPSGSVTPATLNSAVSPIAKQVAASGPADPPVSVVDDSSAGSGILTFTFTAKGADPDRCIAAVNEAANETADMASSLFSQMNDTLNEDTEIDRERKLELLGLLDNSDALEDFLGLYLAPTRRFEYCSFTVVEAASVLGGGSGAAKMGLAGLLGGILLALVVLAAIDYARRPIKGPSDIGRLTKLPVLTFPYCKSEPGYLWENIKFTWGQGASPASVALVPVGAADVMTMGAQLAEAAREDGRNVAVENCVRGDARGRAGIADSDLRIICCAPLRDGVEGARAAHEADATIIAVTAWRDGVRSLDEALAELKMAEANVVGVALASASSSPRA